MTILVHASPLANTTLPLMFLGPSKQQRTPDTSPPHAFDAGPYSRATRPSLTGLGEDDREEPNPEDQMTAPEQGNPLAAVPVVDVHPSGTFKYILARISLNGASKNVVRASRHFDLHVDNFEALRMEIAPTGAVAAMLGGGRITHDTDSVNVYGISGR